jgi:predicted nucleic-acid-binding Zn-ribbon protein
MGVGDAGATLLRRVTPAGRPTMWKCPSCGEDVEDGFNVCWNCQRGKDGTEAPPPDPSPAGLVETTVADGSVEVSVHGKPLTCVVCRHTSFHERDSLLNTRLATFFNFDWANAQAINYICTRCGYIHWFWGE